MTRMNERLLLRIPSDIKQRLEALSLKEGRTVSELIREAIANLLKKREVKQGK